MIRVEDVYVDGRWVQPVDIEWAELEDPSTEEVFATVALAGPATMNDAVVAARRAFDDGGWTSLSHEDRLKYLVAMGEFLTANADKYGDLVVQEVGLPVGFARGGVI